MARFFNEQHEKLFVLAPQTNDDEAHFFLAYKAELDEIFSSFQPLEIEAYTGAIASNDRSQSAGPTEHGYKGVRRIIAGHIQFRSEAQAERAYVLFNDTYIIAKSSRKSRIRLELLYYDMEDLLDLPPVLVVSGVPATAQTWFTETFDAFRNFGRMIKCQRRHRCAIHQCSSLPATDECPEFHDPTVILQYKSRGESDRAMVELSGMKVLDNCILSITTKGAFKPSEKSADYGKRPSSYKTKVSTTYVRPSHETSSGDSSSNMTYQRTHQPQQQNPEPSSSTQYQRLELKPAMDLCNIYVKHIDRSLRSTDLFNLFKRFGRIISARVMEDPATGTSRGFGFVSFSHPTEAGAALLEMDGYDSSADSEKPGTGELMKVRFHEPRVSRPERDHQQQVIKLLQSPLAGHFSFEHVLPITDSSAPEAETCGSHVGHAPLPAPLIVPQPSMFYSPYNPSSTQTSQPVSPFTMHHSYHHHQTSPIFQHAPYMIPPSPQSGSSSYFYYYPQQQPVMHEYYTPQMIHQLQQQPRPPFPTRQQQQSLPPLDPKETDHIEETKDESMEAEGDEESVASGISESTSKRTDATTRASSPPDGGHQRLMEAVQRKLAQGDDVKVNMIVDRLMATLTWKERSLCLFNEEYLERQIRQVLEWQ